MDILVKIERFQIKPNVINLKSTLEWNTWHTFPTIYIPFKSSIFIYCPFSTARNRYHSRITAEWCISPIRIIIVTTTSKLYLKNIPFIELCICMSGYSLIRKCDMISDQYPFSFRDLFRISTLSLLKGLWPESIFNKKSPSSGRTVSNLWYSNYELCTTRSVGGRNSW